MNNHDNKKTPHQARTSTTLSASWGWWWIQNAWQLWKSRPIDLVFFYFVQILVRVVLSLMPVLGRVLSSLVLPFLEVGLFSSCQAVRQNPQAKPAFSTLFSAFSSEPRALKNLLGLGLVYLFLFLLSMGLASVFDEGRFMRFAMDASQQAELQQAMQRLSPEQNQEKWLALIGDIQLGLGIFSATYLIGIALINFTSPLIAWHQMSLGKALFYSVMGFWRARYAMMVFYGVWLAICLTAFVLLGALGSVGQLLTLPVLMALAAWASCSHYLAYQTLFVEWERQ